jgi:AraC family transcriptional regulator of adaptative response/methylated-DNA-[protein]-cysteine methyltransferase
MLVSELQNQFPNDAIELADKDEGLAAHVVDLIDRPERAAERPLDRCGIEIQMRVRDALQKVPANTSVCYASLAKKISVLNAVRSASSARP